MIDEITAGTIVIGTFGVLFGVMFDADFLHRFVIPVPLRK